jgi:hypothetical protein
MLSFLLSFERYRPLLSFCDETPHISSEEYIVSARLVCLHEVHFKVSAVEPVASKSAAEITDGAQFQVQRQPNAVTVTPMETAA